MIRTNFHITDNQIGTLRQESERTGLSISEIVRRAIDYYTGNFPVLNRNHVSAIDSNLATSLQTHLEYAQRRSEIMDAGNFVTEEEFEAGLEERGIL